MIGESRMANGEEKSGDFYTVLGLHKECTAIDLKNAYKKLALRWHPDRCSASGNSMFVEEAKKKFQAIQQAYSVLSDVNKRFLYDVGIYDSDDEDDENGMGDFLSEMAGMMSQTKTNENGEETFEELQDLFEEMFQGDFDATGSSSQGTGSCSTSSSSYMSYGESSYSSKRNSCEVNSTKLNADGSSSFDTHFQSFCLGAEHQQDFKKGEGVRDGMAGWARSSRRQGRKQKLSSGHDVSSNDYSSIFPLRDQLLDDAGELIVQYPLPMQKSWQNHHLTVTEESLDETKTLSIVRAYATTNPVMLGHSSGGVM